MTWKAPGGCIPRGNDDSPGQASSPLHCSDVDEFDPTRRRRNGVTWPLNLGHPGYRLAVERAVAEDRLTRTEADALIAYDEMVGVPSEDIPSKWRQLLAGLAAATTPQRARRIARWTSFDPAALQRAAKRLRAGRVA